jgi:hypothetical protein
MNDNPLITSAQMSTNNHSSGMRSSKKSKWTAEEDERLRAAVNAFGTDSWGKISTLVPTRSGKQCRERWLGQLAPSVSKDVWTTMEDATLFRQHAFNGNRWTVIAAELPGRSALQVKNRWNWLMRHHGATDTGCPPPKRPEAFADVIERRPSQTLFESLSLDNGLFGQAFQEFRAKMFLN